jgi:hypothetical protein
LYGGGRNGVADPAAAIIPASVVIQLRPGANEVTSVLMRRIVFRAFISFLLVQFVNRLLQFLLNLAHRALHVERDVPAPGAHHIVNDHPRGCDVLLRGHGITLAGMLASDVMVLVTITVPLPSLRTVMQPPHNRSARAAMILMVWFMVVFRYGFWLTG